MTTIVPINDINKVVFCGIEFIDRQFENAAQLASGKHDIETSYIRNIDPRDPNGNPKHLTASAWEIADALADSILKEPSTLYGFTTNSAPGPIMMMLLEKANKNPKFKYFVTEHSPETGDIVNIYAVSKSQLGRLETRNSLAAGG